MASTLSLASKKLLENLPKRTPVMAAATLTTSLDTPLGHLTSDLNHPLTHAPFIHTKPPLQEIPHSKLSLRIHSSITCPPIHLRSDFPFCWHSSIISWSIYSTLPSTPLYYHHSPVTVSTTHHHHHHALVPFWSGIHYVLLDLPLPPMLFLVLDSLSRPEAATS